MNKTTRGIIRIFHWLIKLYPRQFRDEYESEMAANFEQGCVELKQSPLSLIWLFLRELRDLPGNVLHEHWADFKKGQRTQRQPDPDYSFLKIILRTALGYGVGFAITFLLYCLIDTLFRSGNTLWGQLSIWGFYIHPNALGVALGTYLTGKWLCKRQLWGSVLIAFLGYIVVYRVLRLIFASLRISPDNIYFYWTQFSFLVVLGAIVAGGVGLIQHGRKSIGWHALAGAIGFNIGWIINNDVSQFILRQATVLDLGRLVVGSTTFFLYFVLPGMLFGAAIGTGLGIADGSERLKESLSVPA